MNNLLDDTDEHEDRASRGADREITLGTTMILLIFFALAVYGAALFGFGYSLGSKHNSTSAAGVEQAPASSSSFNAFKPAPGSPVGAASAVKPPVQTETATVPITPAPVKVDLPVPKAAAETTDADDAALRSRTAPAVAPATATATAAAAAAPVPVAGFGTVVVQVAAVSHQEDADLIATTLKRRGYVVNIRTEADKLLHVQVGPFATRKDAETMKAKLLSDGFNAYIK